ncbi:MAG: D-aminoacyl-tRNA deacylase [Christensenellales bacterium]|jgi:D-tyrosyl-tRNA(Tyr) deacylase|nr:D-tyrosyl-tRNA(Tyr) deacylase [Clostridiales bacterium]
MRLVVQRVTEASVTVENEVVGSIGNGLMVLVGVEQEDTEKDAIYCADKLSKLRIFEDENGKMNLSVIDMQYDALLVSQFTLLGDARGQNRPGFTQAAGPEEADKLYELVCKRVTDNGIRVQKGVFRAHMQVALVNDGPVTILIDSRKRF